jgi:O-antigen ligase
MLADRRLEYAHNDYLQLLIEAGWIGFIALTTGFSIFMWKSAHRIRHMNPRKDPMRFFLGAGAFSGLISLAFHSFFDFNLQIPANCVYFVTLMAILCACCGREAQTGAQRLYAETSRIRAHGSKLKAEGSRLKD